MIFLRYLPYFWQAYFCYHVIHCRNIHLSLCGNGCPWHWEVEGNENKVLLASLYNFLLYFCVVLAAWVWFVGIWCLLLGNLDMFWGLVFSFDFFFLIFFSTLDFIRKPSFVRLLTNFSDRNLNVSRYLHFDTYRL